MNSRGKTQREDYLEELRKMERSLKEGEPTKPLPRTPLEKFSADIEMKKYDLAFAKLTVFEAEAVLKEWRPYMGAAEIEDYESKIAHMRTFQADTEEMLRLTNAECDEALRRVEKATKSADDYLTPEKTSKTHEGVETGVEESQEKIENEEDEEEASPEDLRLQALFSKADGVMAQNKHMINECKVLNAQTEVLLKTHDEMKAQDLNVW